MNVCRVVSNLVLTIQNDLPGRVAVNHLIERGQDDLGCRYLGALVDRLESLKCHVFLTESHDFGFHLVEVQVGTEAAVANRIINFHDGKTVGRGRVEAVDPDVSFTLAALGVPFALGGKNADYLVQMRHDKVPAGVTGNGVKVAIVDSGLDSSAGINVTDSYDVDATPPGPAAPIADINGHGTAMATLIHALAPGASVSVIKAMDPTGSLTLWNLLAALPIAAYDCAADIINLSLGFASFPLTCSACGAAAQVRLIAFDKMIQGIAHAPRAGGEPPIYVAATGNESASKCFNFPAFHDDIVAVGAVTSTGARSAFSNYGTTPHRWHFMAPGGEEQPPKKVTEDVGAGPAGELCRGTSVSAAYVSGMLALLRADARYVMKSRDDFLDVVARDHCELLPGANAIEFGAGQIVYYKLAATVPGHASYDDLSAAAQREAFIKLQQRLGITR